MHKPKHGDPRSEYVFQSTRGVEITYIDFKFGIDRSNDHFHGHLSIPWNASSHKVAQVHRISLNVGYSKIYAWIKILVNQQH